MMLEVKLFKAEGLSFILGELLLPSSRIINLTSKCALACNTYPHSGLALTKVAQPTRPAT